MGDNFARVKIVEEESEAAVAPKSAVKLSNPHTRTHSGTHTLTHTHRHTQSHAQRHTDQPHSLKFFWEHCVTSQSVVVARVSSSGVSVDVAANNGAAQHRSVRYCLSGLMVHLLNAGEPVFYFFFFFI